MSTSFVSNAVCEQRKVVTRYYDSKCARRLCTRVVCYAELTGARIGKVVYEVSGSRWANGNRRH